MVSNTDAPQVVPAGKVWKIESVISDGGQDSYPVQTSGSTQSFFGACGVPAFYYLSNLNFLVCWNIPSELIIY